MDKLRVGVAGLRRGRQFVEVFRRHPDCRVVAVCDPNPKALAAYAHLAAYADFDAFLDERLDIVAVISPGPFHDRGPSALLGTQIEPLWPALDDSVLGLRVEDNHV